jgi:hypothetical protein
LTPATVTISGLTIANGNVVFPNQFGGGILLGSGTLNLTGTIISGNSATGNNASGGGVSSHGSGTLNISNSTISGVRLKLGPRCWG